MVQTGHGHGEDEDTEGVLWHGSGTTLLAVEPGITKHHGCRTSWMLGVTFNLAPPSDATASLRMAQPTCSSQAKAQVAVGIDPAFYKRVLGAITGESVIESGNASPHLVQTRFVGTRGSRVAADYMARLCTELGYQTKFQEWQVGKTALRNLICIKASHADPDGDRGVVVVGAHYDSRDYASEQPGTAAAPGAVDNGSGTAAVLAIAKSLRGAPLERTVHFVLFDGEEVGLLGSRKYVDLAAATKVPIKAAFIMDMIGYPAAHAKRQSAWREGVWIEYSSFGGLSAQLVATAKQNFKTYAEEVYAARGGVFQVLESTKYYGSDHLPFIEARVPVFLAIEADNDGDPSNYKYYHHANDVTANVDLDQALAVATAIAASTYDLACPHTPTTPPPPSTPAAATGAVPEHCRSTKRGLRHTGEQDEGICKLPGGSCRGLLNYEPPVPGYRGTVGARIGSAPKGAAGAAGCAQQCLALGASACRSFSFNPNPAFAGPACWMFGVATKLVQGSKAQAWEHYTRNSSCGHHGGGDGSTTATVRPTAPKA